MGCKERKSASVHPPPPPPVRWHRHHRRGASSNSQCKLAGVACVTCLKAREKKTRGGGEGRGNKSRSPEEKISKRFNNQIFLSDSHPKRCTAKRHWWYLSESHLKGQDPLFPPSPLFHPTWLSRSDWPPCIWIVQGERRERIDPNTPGWVKQ